jgi:hypothetical protein
MCCEYCRIPLEIQYAVLYPEEEEVFCSPQCAGSYNALQLEMSDTYDLDMNLHDLQSLQLGCLPCIQK